MIEWPKSENEGADEYLEDLAKILVCDRDFTECASGNLIQRLFQLSVARVFRGNTDSKFANLNLLF